MSKPEDVLVVDDDRNLRDIVSAVLQQAGYGVHCAENGAQALAMLYQRRPAALVVDLSMPVMSGWELLEIVRQDGDLSGLPVVVLSDMRAPDGVPHLAKPVSPEDLLETVERLCAA